MLRKLLLTTAVVLAAIHSTYAADDDCPSWTNWFDLDDPGTGDGDTESLADIRAAMPGQVCEDPTVIDGRMKDPVLREILWEEAVFYNLPFKMTCLNADQDDGECEDYEVRFCCPDVVPECLAPASWTTWFDNDNPDGDGDSESVVSTNLPQACNEPLALQARVKDTKVDAKLTGEIVGMDRTYYFSCTNADQPDNQCEDYEVRFCCPDVAPECLAPSSWTNWFDLNTPLTSADLETLGQIKSRFPNQVCDDPTALQARVIATGMDATLAGEVVTIETDAFLCDNADQPDNQCEDYEVRFCCPDVVPECDDPCSWTNWFDMDDPASDNKDYERHIRISHHNPGEVCRAPKDSQARVIATEVDSSLSGERTTLTNTDFLCEGVEQTDNTCEDYEIRYCCPDVVPICPEGYSWTEWFDEDDPDDGVDIESIFKVLTNNGPGAVCRYPKASQARDIETKVDSSLTGQIVNLNLNSFSCVNTFQAVGEKCLDYEIRFCCPDDPDDDESPTGYIPTEGPTTALVQTTSAGGPRPPCSIDIVIVVDLSSSISIYEFLRILQFLIQLNECFNDMDVRIGVITYACLPYFDIPLGEHSFDDLLDATQHLERKGGRSRTGQALHYVKCMTDFREDACPVTVVMSDGTGANGQGTDDYVAQAAMLRDSGIDLYAVAFGYPFLLNTAALGTITGSADRVFDPNDPCALANLIIEECCEEN